jgi:hypothetical protein
MNFVKLEFQDSTNEATRAAITDTLTAAPNLEQLIEAWVINKRNSLGVEYSLEDNTERSDAEHFGISFIDPESGNTAGIAFCSRADALLPYSDVESFDRFFSPCAEEESEDPFFADDDALDEWLDSLKFEENDAFMGRVGPRSALMSVVASVARSLGGTVVLSPGESNFMANDEEYSQELAEAGLNLSEHIVLAMQYVEPSGDIGPHQMIFDEMLVAQQ